ncbi:MAG: LysM peptidoglycan-binding domain-containing protein [Nevskiaceae bacterium]|nr:LysM peptidoglycan-binding domain-containing protein [Nevskiaceae bacterium]
MLIAIALAGCTPARMPRSAPIVRDAVPVSAPEFFAADDENLAASLPPYLLPEHTLADLPPVPRDLLDRIRAGMALPELKNTQVDRQAARFSSSPESIQNTFTRAIPYLHYIVGEVEARGMPLELALLPIIESAFEPYAYSRVRAMGLWQFMPLTGTQFSLKQDWWYDGRRDVVAATQAALNYLQYLHDKFDGDWLLAIGAYDCGEGTMGRAIRANQRAGKRTDFFSLKLPAETRQYIPRLLAMARIVANPEDYNLTIFDMADEPYFVRVDTGGQMNMTVAAELAGISTEEMYALNPAHHRWATDPSGPHFLLVPVESVERFEQGLQQMTPDERMRVERYQVSAGDTLAQIATRFGTTPQQLQMLNDLDAKAKLQPGDELRVPSSVTTLPEKVLLAAARADARTRITGSYVVRRGDTLWSIARRSGMSVNQLARLNGLNPKAVLRTGQKLDLEGKAATAAQRATGSAGS